MMEGSQNVDREGYGLGILPQQPRSLARLNVLDFLGVPYTKPKRPIFISDPVAAYKAKIPRLPPQLFLKNVEDKDPLIEQDERAKRRRLKGGLKNVFTK